MIPIIFFAKRAREQVVYIEKINSPIKIELLFRFQLSGES